MTPKNFAPFLTIFTKKSNSQSQNEPILRCWNCYFYSINEELCCSSKFIEKRRESGMRLSRACVKHVSQFFKKESCSFRCCLVSMILSIPVVVNFNDFRKMMPFATEFTFGTNALVITACHGSKINQEI